MTVMPDLPPGVVRIECDGGAAWNTKVTIDGVTIPCSQVTWTAGLDGRTRAILEIPNVHIDVTARELLVRYTGPPEETREA